MATLANGARQFFRVGEWRIACLKFVWRQTSGEAPRETAQPARAAFQRGRCRCKTPHGSITPCRHGRGVVVVASRSLMAESRSRRHRMPTQTHVQWLGRQPSPQIRFHTAYRNYLPSRERRERPAMARHEPPSDLKFCTARWHPRQQMKVRVSDSALRVSFAGTSSPIFCSTAHKLHSRAKRPEHTAIQPMPSQNQLQRAASWHALRCRCPVRAYAEGRSATKAGIANGRRAEAAAQAVEGRP